ncbi:MAG: sensor histidine kinase, partial [Sphingorhabdus sp.]
STAFLGGGGEMGAIIRAWDWSTSKLGDPGGWPQALKTALRLILNSRHPMYIWWGPDLLCFYNDAYRPSIGDERHPSSIGQPGREVWAEIWPLIEADVNQVLRGEGGTWAVDALVPITRGGQREDVYWTYSYSPIHDESAPYGVGGILVVCHETTAHVLQARRRDALAQLDDIIRNITNPADISFAASRVLAQALGAIRAGYGVFNHEQKTISVERAWSAANYANVTGTYFFTEYGNYIDELLQGIAVRNNNIEVDPRTRDHICSFHELNIHACLDVPVTEENVAVAQMFVHSDTPRQWTDEEVAFASEVAKRTRIAITRRKAEQALRESEERFRLLADTIAEVFYVLNLDTKTIEYVSPAYADIWQQPIDDLYADATSYWKAIHPDDLPIAVAAFERQPLGESTDIRYRLLGKDGSIRHIHDRAYVVPDTGFGRRVVGLAEDVTSSTQTRLELRQALDDKELLMREIDHRVSNSLAMIGSLLNMQRNSAREAETREALDGAAARVIAIARIHDRLHKTKIAGTVEFGDYLKGLCTDINRTIGSQHCTFGLSTETIELPVETAIPLGIIANELITNACKHSNPNENIYVEVAFSRKAEAIELDVVSPGQMPSDFDPNRTQGLGLQVISALAGQIKGSIAYPAPGMKACFKVRLPYPNESS